MSFTLRKSLRRAAVVAIAAASGLACAALAGLEDGEVDSYDAGPLPQTDGGGPPDPCSHLAPPSNALDAAIAEDLPLLIAAVRETNLPKPGSPPPGWDLDGVCTCNRDPNTRWAGAESCQGSVQHCDPVATGVDNAFMAATSSIPASTASTLLLNCPTAVGEFALVYAVSGYNGERDDSAVQFTYYQARPSENDGGAGLFPYAGQDQACLARLRGEPVPADAGSGADRFLLANPDPNADAGLGKCKKGPDAIPQWNGCDAWNFESSVLPFLKTVRTLASPRFGYVRDGVLVVSYPGTFQATLGDNSLTMSDAILTARIELLDTRGRPVEFGGPEVKLARAHRAAHQAPSGYEAEIYDSPVRMRLSGGVLAGRMDPKQIYELMGRGVFVDVPGVPNGDRFCQNEFGRGILRQFIRPLCDGRDLAENAQADHRGQVCTRMSFAFTFESEPAFPASAVNTLPQADVDCDAKLRAAAGPDGGYERWRTLDCDDAGTP